MIKKKKTIKTRKRKYMTENDCATEFNVKSYAFKKRSIKNF